MAPLWKKAEAPFNSRPLRLIEADLLYLFGQHFQKNLAQQFVHSVA